MWEGGLTVRCVDLDGSLQCVQRVYIDKMLKRSGGGTRGLSVVCQVGGVV